ncbi:hypothetical protein [Janthinobacterium sp. PAMC25594]|uniref:hypothetical protein n=1 Tax=Janthinobacterium sp. PAMC25594 TaxID=2861284 RepID=UPI001C62567C|nr:hypothetical protein [Janthinobacterium sp. PAMC25594]QYG06581.1 hypothetical protein KY494_25615 [Janthinobacterium sp. PAMC25594]
MSYQLVLQVRGDSLGDFDVMMNLEKELSIELNDIVDVDGHDMGCGEINIFILATNPTAVFEASKPILDRFKLLHDVKAGYRLLSDDIYTTIWPDGSTDDFLVA